MVRYFNPADHNPRRITKADKDFARRLDFKDKKFLVKIRDIHKIEKQNSTGIIIFGYENNEKYTCDGVVLEIYLDFKFL